MTKGEFIDAVLDKMAKDAKKAKAESPDVTKKDATALLEASFDVIKAAVKKEGKLAMAGFGTFTLRKRKARMAYNPIAKKKVKVGASKTVGFKPAKAFKDSL